MHKKDELKPYQEDGQIMFISVWEYKERLFRRTAISVVIGILMGVAGVLTYLTH